MGTYKQFTGAAPLAHLSGGITGTPTTFSVDNAVGFPTGAGSVPFVVCIDRTTSSEEKILCSAMSGNIFTIQTRGFDGTVQTNHNSGANVEHVIDADSMNDGQQHVHDTTRDDHTQLIRTDGTRAFTGPTTAPAFNANLTGTAGRFVGVSNGAPSSGTFLTNDYTVDSTNGGYWFCTAGGTPGTWALIGGNYRTRVFRSGLLSLTSTATIVKMDGSSFDPHSSYSSSTGLYTVPVAGYYRVYYQIGASPGSSQYVAAMIYRNGVVIAESTTMGNGTFNVYASTLTEVNCAVSDTIGFYTLGSGNTGNVVTSTNDTFAVIEKVT